MQQKVIFSLDGIKVNATQIIANEQIFALQELKSVKHGLIEPKRWFAYVCILTGIFLLNFDEFFAVMGFFGILLGAIALSTTKTIYTVVIETIYGEHQAFASESHDAVESVIRAINTAMISHGYL